MIKRWNLLIFIILMIPCVSKSDEVRWMAIGKLNDWFSSAGCEREVGRTLLVADQQDGLRYDAQFKWQDTKAAKALWIGTRNYSDPLVSKDYNYKVAHCGPRVLDEQSEFMPVEMVLYGKYDHPNVIVDGALASKAGFVDLVDEVDESIPSDRMIYNVINTSIGITITRHIYGYSNPYYDNFFIHDLVFKNTGIIDKNGQTVSKSLQDVYFFYLYRYSMTREACGGGLNWMPQSAAWGHNTMNDARGENPNGGDPFRCQYSWHGRHSKAGFDNIGAPYSTGDGRLGAPQFVGTTTLHADKSANEPVNDPYQPKTTYYIGSDVSITSNNSQFNDQQMADEYAVMSAGHPAVRHADMVGNDFADIVGGTPGGFSSTQGFGPYNLDQGDSIHIVFAEGVAGLSRREAFRIGRIWKQELSSEYILPSGATTTNKEEFKNTWVMTGRDSLFQTFNRAIEVFNNQYTVPEPPPPPDYFEVKSGGDRIVLTWSANAEMGSNFQGYRIYRAIHKPDTLFDMIYECGGVSGNPVTNEFNDFTAIRGFNYYYYIVSYDNGTTNTIQPGIPMESSKFFTITTDPAYLRRPAGSRLEDIRIVPNPYNIKATDIQFGEGGKDRIMFYNLPPECVIKIFTARGDLVETINHTDGSGDESWNSVSQYRQVVVSGLYIVYFETPDGGSIVKKLAIIR